VSTPPAAQRPRDVLTRAAIEAIQNLIEAHPRPEACLSRVGDHRSRRCSRPGQDGLFDQDTILDIQEHFTDTGGASDHVLATSSRRANEPLTASVDRRGVSAPIVSISGRSLTLGTEPRSATPGPTPVIAWPTLQPVSAHGYRNASRKSRHHFEMSCFSRWSIICFQRWRRSSIDMDSAWAIALATASMS
jgi:hypothetical protein